MSVELRPLGVKCNIQCQYCYQNPQRDAGNVPRSYDLEKMMRGIERAGGPFSLFGGEALVVPEEDLEALFAWGLEKYGSNAIQTNGTLINDRHIHIFKKYRVQVGVSVDGPGELNDVRWAGSLKKTREATEKAHAAIERLCREGIVPSLIVTLHRNNATTDKLPIMHDWMRRLERLGIRSARLHLLEVDHESVREKYALSTQENLEAMLSFAALERELSTLRFDIFVDMRNLLLGQDRDATCVWGACDPYTTRAVQGVEGNGQTSNCGRTNKDGIDFTKSSSEGFERYLALYHTPQESGGCRDCRFFVMCKGQCPGTAIDNDWRNRTEHCEVWKGLYEWLEERIISEGSAPISLSPLRQQIERAFLGTWARGHNTTIASVLAQLRPAPQGEARPPRTAGDIERIIATMAPVIGLVIDASGALPYVHLQLESRRRHYPKVPCLIYAEGSPHGDRIRPLCKEYGASFVATERRGGNRGELAGLLAGFDWAKRHEFDLLVRFHPRWIVTKDWTAGLRERAFNTQYETYSAPCSSSGSGFRSECAAYHVPTWFASGAVEQLSAYARALEHMWDERRADPEAFLHALARRVHEGACRITRSHEALFPRPPRADGYGEWSLLGPSRKSAAAGVLWRDSARQEAYWELAQAWGLTAYQCQDFPIQG
jgi:uncharacterized protein